MAWVGLTPCGFCGTGQHQLCPGSIRNASAYDPKRPETADRIWVCPCSDAGHGAPEGSRAGRMGVTEADLKGAGL